MNRRGIIGLLAFLLLGGWYKGASIAALQIVLEGAQSSTPVFTITNTNVVQASDVIKVYEPRAGYGFVGNVCTDQRGSPTNGVSTITNVQTIAMSDQTRPFATISKLRPRWGA